MENIEIFKNVIGLLEEIVNEMVDADNRQLINETKELITGILVIFITASSHEHILTWLI